MADFEIAGVAYQSKMMDGEVQTLVLKRMLPAFTALITVAEKIRIPLSDDDDDGPDETASERIARIAMPVAQRLADLKDEDVRFVMNACMDVTTRRVGTGTGWVGVRQGGAIQDKTDGRFITRVTIAWHVLSENFGDMLGSLGVDLAALKGMAPLGLV